MFLELTTLLLLIQTSFSEAQTCTGTSCSTCNQQTGCGWCAATQSCLPGNTSGPLSSQCYGRAWFFPGSNACPDCASLSGCTACTDDIACGWIASQGVCTDSTATNASQFCPCSEFEQCTDCLRGGSRCTFCSNTGLCQDAADSTCTPLASCTCSSITDCAICVEQDDICGWCSSTGGCVNLGDCPTGEGDVCNPPPNDRNALIIGLSVGWFVFVVTFVILVAVCVIKPSFLRE